MRQITGLTADARQTIEIVLDDNSIVNLYLEYRDSIQGWIYNVSRNDFTANGRNLVTNVNVLRTFENYIPFGLAVVSTDNLDPAFLEDFETGRITLYILNESDINYTENNIYVR